MKRVLMTGDTIGGVWTFALELAGSLARHDIEVAFAAMGGLPTEAQRVEAQSIPNLRLFESAFKLEWMEDPWADVEQAGTWLLELERSFAPDVVHLNSCAHGSLPWSAPVVLTMHSCVLSWWAAVKGRPVPPDWDRYCQEVRRSLRSADLITAPTAAMLAAVRDNYGELPAALVVLNGRAPGRFRRGAKEDFILAAGRLWDEAKNFRALSSIAPRLAWPVYMAGETGAAQFPGCRVLGRLSPAALADWYARAGIYALPACYEPFGFTALEAALSGCALVLGDIPSLREIWDGAALFVPPDDTRRLRSVLNSLITNRRLRSDLADRAYHRAFDLGTDRMADEYLAAYQEALRGVKTLCA